MGCNVSPYRGGVLKYKETVTASATIAKGTTETLYTNTEACIMKILIPSNATLNQKIWLNGSQLAILNNGVVNKSGLTFRPELLAEEVAGASNTSVDYRSLTLLLERDDVFTISNETWAQDITLEFTMYKYTWN
jgi:hypothetical protein